MESKEKLNYLINLLIKKLDDTDIDLTEEENDNVLNFNKDIRKELDRLEKQDKAIEIVKKKEVNLSDISKKTLLNFYNAKFTDEGSFLKLTQEELDLLKEVFG